MSDTSASDVTMTREEWLERVGERTAKLLSLPVPTLYVSVGFPKGARGKHKPVGQCWAGEQSADHRPHIFVSPELANPVQVAAVLLHEQVHAAVDVKVGHRGAFVAIAKTAGLCKPWTATTPSPELAAKLETIAQECGPYPHAVLSVVDRVKPGSRLRLWQCACPVKVRVASDDFEATCNICDSTFKQAR